MKSISFLLGLLSCVWVATPSFAETAESVDLEGVWHALATTDSDVRELTWTFKKEGDGYTGVSFDHENNSERKLDRVKVDGKKVTLEIDIEQDGNKGLIKVVAEEKAPGKLVGEWSIEDTEGAKFLSGDITAKKEVNLAGTWRSVATLNDGNQIESDLIVKGENNNLKGTIDGGQGEIEVDKINASKNKVRLEFDFELNGETINVVIEAKTKGLNKLNGKWIVVDANGDEVDSGDWTAKRKPHPLAGTWSVVAVVPNQDDYHGTLKLEDNNGKLTGTSARENGEPRKLSDIKSDGKSLVFTLPIETENYRGTIKVEAQKTANGLEGEWVLIGSDGTEYARESWKATREKQ